MKKIRTFLLSICIVLTLISYAGAKEKLIFSVTIIRHGDRTPYAELVNKQFNHLWKEGIGELTPIGMNQEYMLGCYFRERYVRNFKLLSFNYEYNKIYALSTDYNRTIMSAQSFLTGLYPPGTGPKLDNGNYALPFGYQLIPVRTIPTDQKNLINPEKYDNTIYNELMEKYAFTQKIWIDENNKQSENFNRWSEIFGFKVNSLKDLLIPGDHLQCDIDHKVKLPGGISKKEAYEIIKTRLRACAIRFYPKEIAKFIAGPFMKKDRKSVV